jgi:hypothetical protein
MFRRFSIKNLFGRKSESEILPPTKTVLEIHVTVDPVTGLLKGLPDEWLEKVNNQIPEELQKENIGAVRDAIRCYIEEDVKSYEPPPVFSKAPAKERKIKDPKSHYPNIEILNKSRNMKSDKLVFAEFSKMCKTSNPSEKYEKKKEIGKGASGIVFIATDRERNIDVAIKTIDMKTQASAKTIYEELCLVRELTHKNLINFVDSYFLTKQKNLWLIMEYMNGGT